MIGCVTDVDIIAHISHYERVQSVAVIRTYADLIGLQLPSSARVSSMITTDGTVNAFAAVIGDDGCIIRSVFLPKELHRKAMGQPI